VRGFIKEKNILEILLNNKTNEIEENIIFDCFSNFINIQTIKDKEILFRLDDPGDKFYLILKGKIDILFPKKKQISLTSFEYFKHLQNLFFQDDIGLIKLTLNNNHEKISFENYNDFYEYGKIKAKIILASSFKLINDEISLLRFYNDHLNYFKFFKFVKSFDDINYFKDYDEIKEIIQKEISSNSKKNSSNSESEEDNKNNLLNNSLIKKDEKTVCKKPTANDEQNNLSSNRNNHIRISFNKNIKINSSILSQKKIQINSKVDSGVENSICGSLNKRNSIQKTENDFKTNNTIRIKIESNKNLSNQLDLNLNTNTNKFLEDIKQNKIHILSTLESKDDACDVIEGKITKSRILKEFNLTKKEEKLLDKYSLMENDYFKLEYNMNVLITKTLKEKEYFGDFSLDLDCKKRTASARGGQDNTILGYISRDIYDEYIFAKNNKIITRNVVFLTNISFFKSVSPANFRKRYYNRFVLKYFKKNETILETNNLITDIYIIKEGKVDVSLYVNIFEIENMISELVDKIIEYRCLSESDIKRLEEKKMAIIPKNTLKKDQEENLMLRKNVNLFSLESSEVIGLEPYFLKMKSCYKAVPSLEKISVYELKVKKLENILEEYPDCSKNLQKLAINKSLVILSRLNDIKNSILNLSNFRFKNNFNTLKNTNLFDDQIFILRNKEESSVINTDKGIIPKFFSSIVRTTNNDYSSESKTEINNGFKRNEKSKNKISNFSILENDHSNKPFTIENILSNKENPSKLIENTDSRNSKINKLPKKVNFKLKNIENNQNYNKTINANFDNLSEYGNNKNSIQSNNKYKLNPNIIDSRDSFIKKLNDINISSNYLPMIKHNNENKNQRELIIFDNNPGNNNLKSEEINDPEYSYSNNSRRNLVYLKKFTKTILNLNENFENYKDNDSSSSKDSSISIERKNFPEINKKSKQISISEIQNFHKIRLNPIKKENTNKSINSINYPLIDIDSINFIKELNKEKDNSYTDTLDNTSQIVKSKKINKHIKDILLDISLFNPKNEKNKLTSYVDNENQIYNKKKNQFLEKNFILYEKYSPSPKLKQTVTDNRTFIDKKINTIREKFTDTDLDDDDHKDEDSKIINTFIQKNKKEIYYPINKDNRKEHKLKPQNIKLLYISDLIKEPSQYEGEEINFSSNGILNAKKKISGLKINNYNININHVSNYSLSQNDVMEINQNYNSSNKTNIEENIKNDVLHMDNHLINSSLQNTSMTKPNHNYVIFESNYYNQETNNRIKKKLIALNKPLLFRNKHKKFSSDTSLLKSEPTKMSEYIPIKEFDEIYFDNKLQNIINNKSSLKNIQNLRNRIKETRVKKMTKNKVQIF